MERHDHCAIAREVNAMNCPTEVAEIVLGILQTGLLRIRGGGWANNARRCAVEADHLHNLPSLLANFNPDLLRYYWEVERIAYLTGAEPRSAGAFEAYWSRLEPIVASELLPALAS